MRKAHAFLACALLAAACEATSAPTPAVPDVPLDSMIVPWNDTARLSLLPAGIVGRPVWSSTDKTIATVDENGLVRGVRGGSAIIAAKVDTAQRAMKVRVDMRFIAIAAGHDATCGLTSARTLMCWGRSLIAGGQRNTPDMILTGQKSDTVRGVELSVAWEGNTGISGSEAGAACLLAVSGRVDCWGHNYTGRLGRGRTSSIDRPDSVFLPGPATSVRVGVDHACALLRVGALYCWGRNEESQIGTPTPTPSGCTDASGRRAIACSLTPIRVPSSRQYKEIATGSQSTCAVASDDNLYCWGITARLRDFVNVTTSEPNAIRIEIPGRVHGVSVGSTHACALDDGGQAFCWGKNEYGQLGRGSLSADFVAPAPVVGALRFRFIAAGINATCGVTMANEAYCWGWNVYGELGDGTTSDRSVPTRVLLDVPVRTVIPGRLHTCALALDGAAFCWGRGTTGELGSGIAVGSTIPVRVVTP